MHLIIYTVSGSNMAEVRNFDIGLRLHPEVMCLKRFWKCEDFVMVIYWLNVKQHNSWRVKFDLVVGLIGRRYVDHIHICKPYIYVLLVGELLLTWRQCEFISELVDLHRTCSWVVSILKYRENQSVTLRYMEIEIYRTRGESNLVLKCTLK